MSVDEQQRLALQTISKATGLPIEEIDAALRTLHPEHPDPYLAGLQELYKKNYVQASVNLREAVSRKDINLKKALDEMVETRIALAASLTPQGQFDAALKALEEANRYRSDDHEILLSMACLHWAAA